MRSAVEPAPTGEPEIIMRPTATTKTQTRTSHARLKLGAALTLLAAACSTGPDHAPGDVAGSATPSPAPPRRDRISPSNPVGNGNDFSVQVPGTSTIASSTGSFPSVSGSLSSTLTAYSLQMNTNLYANTAGDIVPCNLADSTPHNCSAWQQFVYDPGRSILFIEYWIFSNDSLNCPGSFSSGASGFGFSHACVMDSTHYSAPSKPLSELSSMVLAATSSSSGDQVTLTAGGTSTTIPVQASLLNLSKHWNQSEFNVFGEYNAEELTLGPSISVEVQNLVTTATPTRNAPTCLGSGTTGETNSLNPIGACCPFGGNAPGIQFLETNIAGAVAPACPTFGPTALSIMSGGYDEAQFTVSGNLVGQSTNTALQPETCTVTVSGPVTTKFDSEADPVTFDFTVASGAAVGAPAAAVVNCDTDPAGTTHTIPITITAPEVTAPTGITVVQGSCTSFEVTVPGYDSGAISFSPTPATFAGGGTLSVSQFCYTLGCDGFGNAEVCAGLGTPTGPYDFNVEAGWTEPSGYGYVSYEDTIPLQVTVEACVPETTAVACSGNGTYSACGEVSVGCGMNVACSCSGANSCSNGVCCPSGLTGMAGTCCAAGDTVNNGMCCPASSNNCTCPSGEEWNQTTQSCVPICPTAKAWCACADECISATASCTLVCKNLGGGGCTPEQAKLHECM
jgi:hypothetical protein